MMGRGSGDGFIRCSDGHTRWGRYGAAGAVFVWRGPDGPLVMLQLRSHWAHEGGTWSCPGGAIDQGETSLEAALRESSEEVGSPAEPWRVVREYVFAPSVEWSYTTAVVEVPAPFGESLNFETTEVRWVPLAEVDDLPLHPGFAAAWPALRAIIEDEPSR